MHSTWPAKATTTNRAGQNSSLTN